MGEPFRAGALNGSVQTFRTAFHFPRDTMGRHLTPRDSMWLMLLNFPSGVGG
jgi:hypothetical protein